MPVQGQSQFPTFETATYTVNRIQFFTTDDAGNPTFKVSDKTGRFMCHYNTFMDAEEGPPGTVGPRDLPLFVHAFGGDPTRLPPLFLDDQTPNPEALLIAESLIEAAQKPTDVYAYKREGAKSAWIQRVTGAILPVGEYLFTIGQITTTKQGQPAWWDGQFGEYIKVNLYVYANADGTASPFAHAPVTVYVNRNPLTTYRALFPEAMFEAFGAPDQMLDAIETFLAGATHMIYGRVIQVERKRVKRGQSKTQDKLDMTSLEVVDTPPTSPPARSTATSAPVVDLTAFYEIITRGTALEQEGAPAFSAPGVLTNAGKLWCRTHLKPIAQARQLTTTFSKMDAAVVAVYLGELVDYIAGLDTDKDDDEGDWG